MTELTHIQQAQAALSACRVDGVVSAVERLKGQSHISWRVERIDAPPVALRIEPQRGILPPYDLPSEARLLRQLRNAGIPVPQVLGVSDTPGRGCIVLEWIDGEVLNTQRMEADAARAYCDTLRRIHTLDWRAAGLDWLPLPTESPQSGPALRERAEIAQRLKSFGVHDAPHIRRLRDALQNRVPNSPPPMLVHGDVNFGNVILRPNDRPNDGEEPSQVAAVLDWEQTHLGDPLSDWGRLAAEDLLGNLDLSHGARQIMRETLDSYNRPAADLHYWTLHQLYKHASATAALSVLRNWDLNQIAKIYTAPTDHLLSP